MKILNYTPHEVDVYVDNKIYVFPSMGLARCKQATYSAGTLNGLPLCKTIYGEVEGLPQPQIGVMYIVSRVVRQALPQREDLLVPNDLIRDSEGNVLGCKALAVV